MSCCAYPESSPPTDFRLSEETFLSPKVTQVGQAQSCSSCLNLPRVSKRLTGCLLLQRSMQKSRGLRWASAVSAFILTSTSVWYGVKIVWGLLGLTWSLLNFVAEGSLSSSLWALRLFIWQPNFWSSLAFSLFLRECSQISIDDFFVADPQNSRP